ncbi:mitogen-activated protein kinase kinase kinase NPK1-like [Oryza glaberrima]|uniref:mitogen-activated protein kinase kinase kinase n=1 Tax=Oryza glaberrima TaxID=4538 RepID=I1QIQ9_ORYGL|nr:mitogen-activated protein kinase kinase kinase NPK1-like [Oryza glaberrima]
MRRDDAAVGGGGGFQELFDSVRRSISFRPGGSAAAATLDEPASASGGGGFRGRISTCLRKSRGMGLLGMVASKSPSPPRRRLLPPPPSPPPAPTKSLSPQPAAAAAVVSQGGDGAGGVGGEEENPPIRWRKGDLLGSGAFGSVFLGMDLDSGELLAVKQVLIGSSNATREKAQGHIRELEDEVKLLKNLSHPNIVRYIGTVREENSLNILLEFVPGGSIQSLLGRLGSFPEAVIRKYTKQILHGLEYLHRNGIIHRDIKGANILVDNKGCIKLADFGASKQVEKLVTTAKTMKGTPYWMAPEVIVGSGHDFSADIWSVGCTVIEMATGKTPWNQEIQEVSLLYYVGTTKSHPPIPEHLSPEAKDFLLKCLQKEPELRSTASDLLLHPFVTGGLEDLHQVNHAAHKETSELPAYDMLTGDLGLNHSGNPSNLNSYKSSDVRPIWDGHSSDDMCQFADNDVVMIGSSFNPMSEPFDDWESPEQRSSQSREFGGLAKHVENNMSENDFTFPCEGGCEEDDELTESKIKEFLDEKAIDLKKLQTPLYEFYNTVNAGLSQGVGETCQVDNITDLQLPLQGRSPPIQMEGVAAVGPTSDVLKSASPKSCTRRFSRSGVENGRILREIASPQLNKFEDKVHDIQENPSISFSERQKKWKEELDQELEIGRVMRLGSFGKAPSPKSRGMTRKRDRVY